MIVRYHRGRALVDREALAQLTGRSVHTIRARCEPVRRHDGRPLYDMEAAVAVLSGVATRSRCPEPHPRPGPPEARGSRGPAG